MKDKKILNPELLEAIAKMRKNPNIDTQNEVVNVALRCTFLVPAIVDTKERIIADENNQVKFDNTAQTKFLLINHPKLGTFIPAFTDEDELSKFKSDEAFDKVAVKFNQLASLVEQMPNVKGFVVNPFSDPLPFNKELLDAILQQIVEFHKNEKNKAIQ